MKTTTLLIKNRIAVFILMSFIARLAFANDTLPCTSLFMCKTGGTWEGKDSTYGYYKALVFREGLEAAKDRILIQITQMNEKTEKETVKKQFWLDSPGIKGYITDLTFTQIDGERMALSLDIQMKAMENLVLREIFILRPNGSFKKIVNAEYVDVFK